MSTDAFAGPRDVPSHRRMIDAMAERLLPDPGVQVSRRYLGDVPVEVVTADDPKSGGYLLYFHPGGYVAGSPALCRQLAGRLARRLGLRVLLPAYRRAPEHPYPAAHRDALAAYRSLLDEGVDPARLAVGGGSAGGGLAVSIMVAARDAGVPLPAAGILLSPWVDLTLQSPAMRLDGPDRPYLAQVAALYLGDASADDSLASPLFADLTGLPPLLVEAGTDERFVDDARALAAAASAIGVRVGLEISSGAGHTFPHTAPDSVASRAAVDRIVAHLGRTVGDSR